MSWRLPPRSRRWRWCLPELASRGATPAWRASWASERKRSIGPISQSSLAALRAPQPGSSSSRGAIAARSRLQVAVELADRAGQAAAAAEQVAGDPHLGCLLQAGELAADPVEPDGPVERARAAPAGSGRARAGASAAVAELDVARRRDRRGGRRAASAPAASPHRPRRVEQRLLQRGSGDRERVDPVRLAARPVAPPLRRRQPAAAPAPAARRCRSSACSRPRVTCRQSSSAHNAAPSNPLRPGDQLVDGTRLQRIERPADLVDGHSSEGVLVHVHPDHDHLRSPPTVGGDRRADRPHSRQLPGSYQVTLDGLGKAAATQHWKVSPQATFGNRVSRRQPESLPTTGQHPPTMTVSSGMSPDAWLGASRVEGGQIVTSTACNSLRAGHS